MPRYNYGEICLVYSFYGCCRHFNANNVDKRILMNDPDLFHSQIQAVQQELEKVNSHLTNTIAAQQAEIESLKQITNNRYANQGNIVILEH